MDNNISAVEYELVEPVNKKDFKGPRKDRRDNNNKRDKKDVTPKEETKE